MGNISFPSLSEPMHPGKRGRNLSSGPDRTQGRSRSVSLRRSRCLLWACSLAKAEKLEQVEFAYIAFKGGGGEVLSATLGGHVTLYAVAMSISAMSYVKEGKFRILAYLGAEKIAGYENVPSFQELYGFAPPNLMGIWGPKGMPGYALEKLDDAFAKGVREPNFTSVMNRMYTPVVYMNRAEVNKYAREEFPKVGEMMKILRDEETKGKR